MRFTGCIYDYAHSSKCLFILNCRHVRVKYSLRNGSCIASSTRNSLDIHKWNLCGFWLDLDNKRKTRNIPKPDKISTEKIFPKNDTFQLLIITLLNWLIFTRIIVIPRLEKKTHIWSQETSVSRHNGDPIESTP